LTDALVSGLNFSKGKGDSEVAWIDAMITARDHVCRDAIADTETENAIDESDKILTLEPLPLNEVNIKMRKKENISKKE
jgi:cleavage and polyadenylation specificity factor subunit 2